MKLRLFCAIVLTSALGGACFAQGAPAAAAASSAPPGAAPAAVTRPRHDPDEMICKWIQELGSRLGGGRVCLTRAQWDKQSRDAQDQLNDTTQRDREVSPPGS
jgi:hypothetical protein